MSAPEDEARLFARYEPNPAERLEDLDPEAPEWIVRPAEPRDVPDLARIHAAREGVAFADAEARFSRELAALERDEARLLLVAEVARRAVAVAFARAGRFERPPDAPENATPSGFYLGGVVVDPGFRRRGIGRALTERRLAWIAERAGEVFYFVNARNRASIDLHGAFGFVECARGIWHPGISFTGGEGVLFRAELSPRARSDDSTRRSRA